MQDIVQTVRTLVAQKRYAEAREFILTTNHPKATEWLRQLDTLMGQSQPTPSVPTFPETQSLSRPQGPDHTAEIYALLKKMYRQKYRYLSNGQCCSEQFADCNFCRCGARRDTNPEPR
jgi:hypothetical protein